MKFQSLLMNQGIRYSIFPRALLLLLLTACQTGDGGNGSTDPQTINSVSPAENSDTSLVTTTVTIEFGIAMDKASVESQFTVSILGVGDVTGTVDYEESSKRAVFTPASDLSSGVQYIATLSSDVLDATGNMPLTSDFVWSFSIAPSTVLVSTNANGAVGNIASTSSDIDAEGRYVVFVSAANLTSIITAGIQQVYRKDTLTGEIRMVSTDTSNQLAANNNCLFPVVSSTGRYIAFSSIATNLGSLPNQGTTQIYLKDMQTGDIEMISRSSVNTTGGNGPSQFPAISENGQFVVFQSAATDLVANDINGVADIFLFNSQSGVIEQVTIDGGAGIPNGDSGLPDVSDDGRYVVFQSRATNLGNCNTVLNNIFVRDRQTSTYTCISQASGGGNANNESTTPAISGDGSKVVFTSAASNLVAGDINGLNDIFMRDSAAATATTLVSVTSTGAQANGQNSLPSVSSDGRYVAFVSAAINLVPGDTNGVNDVFVLDTQTPNNIVRVSVTAGGGQANAPSELSRISDNGRYVSFDNNAPLDPDDTNGIGVSDVYRAYNAAFP
jgi:hypothetical protein